MGQRHELHEMLKDICPHVYFQPPENVKIVYPCIVYQMTLPQVIHANNKPYYIFDAYSLTYITLDPDDPVKDILMNIPMCTFHRFYTADGLNHYSYTIYH